MLQVLGSVQTCSVPRLEVWMDAELLLCPHQGAAGWRPCSHGLGAPGHGSRPCSRAVLCPGLLWAGSGISSGRMDEFKAWVRYSLELG